MIVKPIPKPKELTDDEVLKMLSECKDPPPVKKLIVRGGIKISFL